LAKTGILPGGANGSHGIGGIAQGLHTDVIGVGKGGFLAGQRAYANPLVNIETARLDDAFIEAPGLGAGILKIEVRVIDLMRQNLAKCPRQVAFGKGERGQQQGFGLRQRTVLNHECFLKVYGARAPAGSREFLKYAGD
jgi:hypothetical protein